jgi:tRNA (guanine-N7-)-methyltransferase
MSFSLSRGKTLDAGAVGLTHDALPAVGDQPNQSRFDPRTWWDEPLRDRPLELEIGSGKGTFLVQQATAHRQTNYLGIEWARQFWLYAADRCRRHELGNVRLLHADAATFIEWHVADAVFRQVHIYFPDPWPKKRHHKRRLIRAAFLSQLHRVLTADGRVHIVTDHDDYFAWMIEQLNGVSNLFERRPFEGPDSGDEGEIVGTNFERKYRREGRPFHAMTLLRKD